MSGAGNGSSAFGQWHARHDKKKYTPTFDASLWAIVHDPDGRDERLWALVVIRSWGNPGEPKDMAVDPESGKILGITHLSKTLGVPKQTVSRWAQTQEAKNRLRVSPSGIYAVDDPSEPSEASCPSAVGQNRTKGEDFRRFRALWTEQNQEKVRKREEARQIVEEVNKEELADFRAYMRSHSNGTEDQNNPTLHPELVPDSEDSSPALQQPYIEERARAEEEIDIASPGRQANLEQDAACLPALAELRPLFPDEHLSTEALESLNGYLQAEIGKPYEPEAYVAFVKRRHERSYVRPGLVFEREKGLVKDFIEWAKQRTNGPGRSASVPDYAIPTPVKRQRAMVADAEAYVRRSPGNEKALEELNIALRLLEELEKEAGL